MQLKGPVWLMQPIPYFGEPLKGDWIVEPKVDGWRLEVIRYPCGRIEFWGRRLEKKPNWTERLSSLTKMAEKFLPEGIILDTELYSTEGRQLIPSLFAKVPKAEPLIYVFDVIFYQGKFVGKLPLWRRKEILQKIGLQPPFYLIEWDALRNVNEDLREMVKRGYEGIVIKKLSSTYEIAKDGPMATADWRKIKPGR